MVGRQRWTDFSFNTSVLSVRRWSAVLLAMALCGCITESTPAQDDCDGCDAARPDSAADASPGPDLAVLDAGPPDRGPQDQGPPDQATFDAVVIDATPANRCPTPIIERVLAGSILPLGAYALNGAPSADPDGDVVAWQWSVVSVPPGASVALAEAFANPERPEAGGTADDPATPFVGAWLGRPGRYVFALSVTDDEGATTPSPECPGEAAQIALDVGLEGDIVVVLSWLGEEDEEPFDSEGPDLDLHVLHPTARAWDAAPLDCYYANRTPDWGQPGLRGDCEMMTDSSSGAQPEGLSINGPEDTTAMGAPYRVGVHYYRAESFQGGVFGAARARIRIYFNETLAFERTQVLATTDTFWDVAAIRWTSDGGAVVPIDRVIPQMSDDVLPVP